MRDEASSTIALAGSAGDLDSHDGSADVPSPSPNESATRCATPDDKPTPAANSSASVATPPACCQGRAIAGVAAVCADDKALSGERDTFDITADVAPVATGGKVRDSAAVDDSFASGNSGFEDKRSIATGASAGPRAGVPAGTSSVGAATGLRAEGTSIGPEGTRAGRVCAVAATSLGRRAGRLGTER